MIHVCVADVRPRHHRARGEGVRKPGDAVTPGLKRDRVVVSLMNSALASSAIRGVHVLEKEHVRDSSAKKNKPARFAWMSAVEP